MRLVDKSAHRVLVADDDDAIRLLLKYNLTIHGFQPVLAQNGREAIEMADDEFGCALIDLKMPEIDGIGVLQHFRQKHPEVPVIILSAINQVKEAVGAMKLGAIEYITKPFDLDQLLTLIHKTVKYAAALRKASLIRDAMTRPPPDAEFAGKSPVAQSLLETIKRVGSNNATVLLTGETGVGKGLIARMIHRASAREEEPFISVSCPALPRELLESEMFGHEKGAFTGALRRRIGRIEMAEGGTLFLDEIGDLPVLLQPKLLTVIQDRQFYRLGGAEKLNANIRLIAATNVDLQEKIALREFREDLYYRLNVIPIHIPPLRERLEDLPAICRQVLRRLHTGRQGDCFEISPASLQVLSQYTWPGNVRELENLLERASTFTDGSVIEPKHLPPDIFLQPHKSRPQPTAAAEANISGMTLDEVEKMAIRQTLAFCQNNKAATARQLGITEKSIYNKMARLGLK